MAKRVAVVGLSFRFPQTDFGSFWTDLLAGRDLVTQVDPSRWQQDAYLHPAKDHPGTAYTFSAGSLGDVSGFDAQFFGISPREAALMDPQQRMLLELCWEAMENAGIAPSRLRGSDCGVYIGISSADYSYRMSDDMGAVDASMATGNTSSIAANRLSYVFDLHGPSMAVDTACSSALVAVHQACRAIMTGETTQAIAGGISLHLHPYGFITFSKASMLSPEGRCKVFDASGDGYVRSEGGGLFLLKDYDQAVADGDHILAVIAGSAVNTDGRKSGLTVPNADAQISLMRQAYERAGVSVDEIDYLEAHGTGTAVGDPIETRAIGEALGRPRGTDAPLLIGSIKSNVGHLEAASGVAGLVKAIYCLQHRTVPATIGIKTLNPAIKFDEWNISVATQNHRLRPNGTLTIGVNSFGFGGANAHVILQSPPAINNDPADKLANTAPVPVIVSGKTTDALAAAARNTAEFLQQQPPRALYDIAYHSVMRREWHAERAVVYGNDSEQIAQALLAFADGTAPRYSVASGSAVPAAQGPVFVFSGNGSQWEGMGRQLLADPVFAEAVHEVDTLFSPLAGYTLGEELARSDNPNRYARTEIAQPALFAIQVGVTRMLAQRGIVPTAVIGHSVGEVAAAWACGALTLADAVNVIFHRSRLQGMTKGQGCMTAVGIDGGEALALLTELQLADAVCVAGYNSARGATLAGDPNAMATVEAELANRQVFYKRLDLDYAFHSNAMDGIEGELRVALASLAPVASRIPFISSVDGKALSGDQLDADYWWRNVREPVRFHQAIDSLVADGANVYIEVGPHPVLRSYVNDGLNAAGIKGRVLMTASRGNDDPARIHDVAGQALLSGAQVVWNSLFPWAGRHVALPAYPWQRERYWHPVTAESLGQLQRAKVHPLLGYPLSQHEGIWENQLDTHLYPWLADHVVGDATVFPGSGFAEIALAAAEQWQPGEWLEIEELEIRAPLLVGPSPAKRTRITIDSADGAVRIQAKDLGSTEPWTLHANARILREASDALLVDGALSLPERAYDFTTDSHALLTEAVGLDYGSAFRAVQHGWRESDDTVLAVLNPAASLQDHLAQTHLHPALLDCTFQLIIQLLRDDPAMKLGVAFVPAKIGRLAVRASGGVPHYARARLLRRTPHSITAEFAIYNADGEQIAAVREARFKSIRLSKTAAEALDFVADSGVPSPHPMDPRRHISALDSTAVRTAFSALAETLAAEQTHARYALEIEPLLDSLCDHFAVRALSSLAVNGRHLYNEAIERLRQTSPETAPLLDHVLARATDTGLLQRGPSGWTISEHDDNDPDVIDIWNSLLREYPDYAQIVHAVGRVGLHLSQLLQGQVSLDDVSPAEASLGALARQILGAHTREHMGASLQTLLARAQEELPPGARLNVLEISAVAPAFAVHACTSLNFDVSDYRFVSTQSAAVEQAERLLDGYPDASCGALEESADLQRHVDLVILHADECNPDDALRVQEYVRARLKQNGSLLVIGHHPAAWLDFVAGGRASWWVATDADGHPASCQYSADLWRDMLTQQGYDCGPVVDFVAESLSGPYLLTAVAAETDAPQACALPSTSPTPEDSPAWLVLSGASDASHALLQRLCASLSAAGHRVLVHNDTAPAEIDTVLAQANAELGHLHGILHLDGLFTEDDDAATMLQTQVRRCAIAAAVAQGLERSHSKATLWLLTAGAAQTLARTDTTTTGMLKDAPLWGYGRTMMNEAAQFGVRLLDLPHTEPNDTLLDALVRELQHPDAEHEAALTADGHRYAPRLRTVARPAAPTNVASRAEHISLGFEFPGQLRNLRWQASAATEPADDQLEIEVRATGLNFRDVMYALGLLSDEAIENGFAGPTLGLEFAGIVKRVGPNAEGDYQPGDAVVGFGPASFSNRVLTKASAIAPIPEGISFEAAATIPSTFFTVYYALHHLAQLEEGEKILIHGAAGGVGIAAIQFAQARGAEIYATAGSEEKRDFLRLMGVQHIYDSRSLAYADEILADTGGKGVDVVLNSLAGEAVNRNLRVLKPFGRFLELGKRDFYENTRIGLRPFRNNISYFGIDADQLMQERPALTRRLFGEMMELFKQGVLHPLPYQEFDANNVVDAFRYMQQARQIGKIVITYRNGIRHVHHAVAATSPHGLALPAEATYLVTGGLSGFGLRTAQWLAEQGARHLVLVSRSGPASDTAQAAIAQLQHQGVNVYATACDVTDAHAVRDLMQYIRANMPPLRGVVHAAMVIDDCLVRNATAEQIERVLAPKVVGGKNLDDATRDLSLDFFILYSSGTTLFGNPGQANYVAANMWLEALAQQRRAHGLPATCVRWGAIDDVGYLARNTKIKDALQSRMGGAALASGAALDVLEAMVQANASGLGVLELDWRALRRFLPSANSPKFSLLARRYSDGGDDDGDARDVAHLLATMDDEALHPIFVDMIKAEVSEILRVSPDKIHPEVSVYDMGLDSLMGVELVVALENRFGIRLPVMALNESPTLSRLAAKLIQMLRGDGDHATQDAVLAQVEQVVSQHTDEVPAEAMAKFADELKSGNLNNKRMIH
ncbi:type I polyketide synthase [Bordetella sp. 02P26C-1]|uniref:type I polyketide synthase n=1 Tax=Bordetella sp. 02P26C-1 TaxID=2683195 RepID=UPI0013543361|nr:type I polyketide synthase [Bordetella sp. 02P26C-1]MVW79802.1 SDR family NAD(P)-dependent oxidoreductase [Bordetella sp. 02P26C-1]